MESRFAFACLERDVDRSRLPVLMIEIFQFRHLLEVQDRRVQHQTVALIFGRIEQVAFWSDETFDRHHDLFAS